MHSANLSFREPTEDDEEHDLPNHRIRHLKGLFIRNLTPFPRRDSVASTLSSHNTTLATQRGLEGSYIPDDADLVLSRRRTRKTSSTSVVTLRAIQQAQDAINSDRGAENSPNGTRQRRTSRARPPLSFPHGVPNPTASRRPRSSSPGSIRSSHRFAEPSSPLSPIELLFPNHHVHAQGSLVGSSKAGQRSLEKVVSTRLVETMVTLSVPSGELRPEGYGSNMNPTERRSPSPTKSVRSIPASNRKGPFAPKTPSVDDAANRRVKAQQSARSPPAFHPAARAARMSRGSSSSTASTSPRSSHSTLFSDPSTASTSRPTSPTNPVMGTSSSTFYVSPQHRASTNPSWLGLDPDNEFSLAACEGSFTRTSLTLWASLDETDDGHDRREAWIRGFDTTGSSKGKGKEREQPLPEEQPSWYPIHTWDIDLKEARPLPQEYQEHPDRLPPNTLLVSLAPSGQWYWFPPPPSPNEHAQFESGGHNSDGDEAKEGLELRRGRSEAPSRRSKGKTKLSGGLQDLIRLVSLEVALSDTIASKDAVVRALDQTVLQDSVSTLRREASERKFYIDTLGDEYRQVDDSCTLARKNLAQRREGLDERRRLLLEAHELLGQDRDTSAQLHLQVAEKQNILQALSRQLMSRRTTLIRTIDFIYPIEPLSSGDLLFTILDVPLPLPNGPSEPAPPTSLAGHPSVNENAVASALGYAAHVVILIATYLGRLLPYPISYAASRSLIRDPISAMQGPRVFPLFSSGVETYRFEYAVYLLNKDIEILMTEKNLRATDMRHTLPNIKNLLLTLTTGSSEEPKLRRREVGTDSSWERTAGTASETETSGQVSTTRADDSSSDRVTHQRSGTDSTPRRQFLSPLAAMLRLKYASTIREAVESEQARSAASPSPDSVVEESPKARALSSAGRLPLPSYINGAEGSDRPLSPDNGTTAPDEISGGEQVAVPASSPDLEDDDTRTERGVQVLSEEGSDATGAMTPTSQDTIKASSIANGGNGGGGLAEGYGGMFSSFFRRGSGRKDVEKATVKAVEDVSVNGLPEAPLPSVPNAIS